jgi:S-adenosylmethionine hydrolase
MPSIITLTTDFGVGSPYVAALKGVILSINPDVRLIDLSHSIRPQQVREAAQLLNETTRLFPAGTIHLVVVDPGVGTSRAIIYVEIEEQRFVCPDNGLLSLILKRGLNLKRDLIQKRVQEGARLVKSSWPPTIRHITSEQYFRHPISDTFHGRDIMAPIAAHLSLGLSPKELGPTLESLQELAWPGAVKVANQITGEIIAVDSFGNLITNITRAQLGGVPTSTEVGIFSEDHETRGIFTTYADQPAMTLIALIGSCDQLELAIVNDSATTMLGLGISAPVEVRW